jgi:HSP20 family protein
MFSLIPWGKKKNDTSLSVRDDHPFALIRREFDSLFDRFFGGLAEPFGGGWGWGLDVRDDGGQYVVRAEAPGFEPEEFDLQLSGDVLTIRAEHRHEHKDGDKAVEQHWSRYERSVTLPAGAESDKVEATYRNGVLEVRVPKSPEAQPRRIAVKSA